VRGTAESDGSQNLKGVDFNALNRLAMEEGGEGVDYSNFDTGEGVEGGEDGEGGSEDGEGGYREDGR
jgi:hypothetical protein